MAGYFLLLLWCTIATVAGSNPWDKYMLSPDATRTMVPVAWTTSGGPASLVAGASPTLPVRLSGKGAAILFDFGKEVGGFTILDFPSAGPDNSQSVSIAYSESTYYVNTSDHSNGGKGPDGTISTGAIAAKGESAYTPPVAHMRGGFRYMRLAVETDGWVEVALPHVHFTAAPNMPDPSAWENHFYSSDDLLNRIWYGCGYTTQLCSIDPTHGRQWPPPASGWNNDVSCGEGDTILVDGAKRDRMVWPGDMGVSVVTALVTTGDGDASANALKTLYKYQDPSGMLPYVGPPIAAENAPGHHGNSDTYHMWALIGTCHMGQHYGAGNTSWLATYWSGFQRGVNASVGQISATNGLMDITHTADWARGGQGGFNIAGNCLLHEVLRCGAQLAGLMGDVSVATEYTTRAAQLNTAINAHLWDDAKGAFLDNPTSKIHPQDGNSLAVWFNVTSDDRKKSISAYLQTNWNQYGSQSPEWNMDIGTFPGSMEVHAHMAGGEVARAHDLMRLQWGYMLNHTESTQSTFWEGYHRDGTFAYQGIYMSNAHGWATGPAGALTSTTLGITQAQDDVTTTRGVAMATNASVRFVVHPHPADLTFCSGTRTFLGVHGHKVRVHAAWDATADTQFVLTVNTTALGAPATPTGTKTLVRGTVVVPFHGSQLNAHTARLTVGGAEVWSATRGVHAPASGLASVGGGLMPEDIRCDVATGHCTISNVPHGHYTFAVSSL